MAAADYCEGHEGDSDGGYICDTCGWCEGCCEFMDCYDYPEQFTVDARVKEWLDE